MDQNENFKFFAMMYLNDWYYWDKPLMQRLAGNDSADALEALNLAATTYKIIRTFKEHKKETTETRLSFALNELNKVQRPVNANVVDTVEQLSSRFSNIYTNNEKNFISASSKLLWLKFKSPLVIYDGRAFGWLNKQSAEYRIAKNDYSAFRNAWVSEFKERESEIKDACVDLFSVKEYSQASGRSDEEIKSVTSKKWFRERVFDKYIWFNAND